MRNIFFFLMLIAFSATAKTYSIESPNGRLSMNVSAGEHLTYSLSLDGESIINDSEIAIVLDDG